jgi:hypothetical protein
MELPQIHLLIESYRKEHISAPRLVKNGMAFEYDEQSLETVVILKLVRSAQALTALAILGESGLFPDMGAALRGFYDCVEDIYFLLEAYPNKPSKHIEQFIKNFFEGTIDGYLNGPTHQVQRDKIRSAHVRVLKGAHDDAGQKLLERMYKTFSGYTHAGYAHIMEVYNGHTDSFNLGGVPSEELRRKWREHYDIACNALLMAGAYSAQKFGKKEYYEAMMKGVTRTDEN